MASDFVLYLLSRRARWCFELPPGLPRDSSIRRRAFFLASDLCSSSAIYRINMETFGPRMPVFRHLLHTA